MAKQLFSVGIFFLAKFCFVEIFFANFFGKIFIGKFFRQKYFWVVFEKNYFFDEKNFLPIFFGGGLNFFLVKFSFRKIIPVGKYYFGTIFLAKTF